MTVASPSPTPALAAAPRDLLERLHRTMVRIRLFEQKALELFMSGELPGFLHSCLGQEAVAAGVCAALREDDYITSTHRGHGHVLAKGLAMDRMMAELYGKTTGYCKGKGGSMHIADFARGVLGANGIVAAGLPIAAGAALSARMRRSGQVVAAFLGDGATSQGAFHEALNLAAVWNLPLVCVCENNLYAVSTPVHRQMRVASVSERAAAYGIPGLTVDGNDVIAVYQAAYSLIERARRGEGPALLECRTYRWLGHYVGDPASYRPAEETAWWKARDPLSLFEQRLREEGGFGEEQWQEAYREARDELEAAVAFARGSPDPRPEDALEDVWP